MDQNEYKSKLNDIKKGKPENRSKVQRGVLYNIEMLYRARNSVIKFFHDYSLMVSEAKHKSSYGKGLEI